MNLKDMSQWLGPTFGLFVLCSLGYAQTATSLTITTQSLEQGAVGQNYSQTVVAVGGYPPYTFYASGLPMGLDMSTAGVIAGVPPVEGSFTVTVQVMDMGESMVTQSFPLVIKPPLLFVTTGLPNGSQGQSYFQSITATGGTSPYTYTGSGFPQGLTISPAGAISGTPSEAGAFTVTLNVMDSFNHVTTNQFPLTIYTLPSISTVSPLPAGTAGVTYSQTLGATGGVGPYTFFVLPTSTNPLPPGFTLSKSGVLGGTPTAAGAYTFTLQVIDQNHNSGIKAFQITVNAAPAGLNVSPLSLQFSAAFGGDVPGPQQLAITSGGVPIAFTVQVDDGNGGPAPSWLQATIVGGTTPGVVRVGIAPNALAVGTYVGRVRVAPAGALASLPPVNIAVTFTVLAASPKLSVTPSLLRFRASAANPQTQQQTFVLRNTGGGGAVPFSLTVVGNSPWITGVRPSATTVQANAPALTTVAINSQGLAVGGYRDTVRVNTSLAAPYDQFDIPVSLFVASQGPAMSVAPSGVRLATRQGNSTSRTQQVLVRNVGDPGTVVNWTAQVVRGSDLLTLVNASGASMPGNPVSFGIKASATAANSVGGHYALIQVSDPQSLNAPQFVVVVVDVAAAGTPAIADPDPAGLVFVAAANGSAPAAQQVTVNTTGADPVAYSVATSTDDGANWLSASASAATTSQANPAQVAVTVTPGALSAGIYNGQVNLGIGSVVRSVNVTLILKAAGSVASPQERKAAGICAATAVALGETGLVNHFSVPAGWPATLAVQVADNCGNAVPNAAVVASFSNGDPPITLTGDQYSGSYVATWQPGVALPQMTVTLDATSGSLNPAEMQLAGNVDPNATPAPSLVTAGLLNNLNPLVGAPLAPGTVTQVYGDNLAPSPGNPTTVPLPVVFNGIEALVGGLSAPFFYVSKTQLVVQLPTELQPNKTYSAVLVANGQYTLPQDVDLVTETPGTVAFSDGRLVAQHADYTLVDATHPAKPGEPLTIYLVGMGATTPAVASGSAAPSNPLATVPPKVQVTVDGQSAVVSFAGLTPGGVGLYQINFTVPAGAKTGSLGVVITQDGVPANATTLIVSR